MMDNMPEECRAVMQKAPESCMSAMQQMMRGGMHGGMMEGRGESSVAGAPAEAWSEARTAYEEAMVRMHGPMLEGIAAENPDAAFVRGMIPHHQGAIDMAKVVQQYGGDEQIRNLATRIIEAQGNEIAEMREWLARNAQ